MAARTLRKALFLLFWLCRSGSAEQSLQSAQSAQSVMRRAGTEASRRKSKPLMRSHREQKEPEEPAQGDVKLESVPPVRKPLFESLAESDDLSDLSGCGLAPWSSWSLCSCGGGGPPSRRLRTRDALGLSEEQLPRNGGGSRIRFSGELLVTLPGRYAFQATGPGSLSALQVGAALRVKANATHTSMRTSSSEWVRWLAKGAHSLMIEAEAPETGILHIPLRYRGPDTQDEPIFLPTSVLRHEVGKDCQARAVEAGRCPACAVDCAWSDWADWSKCVASTAPCGKGQETRTRSVQRRAATGEGASLLEGGRACEGQGSEQRSCHVNCGRTFW